MANPRTIARLEARIHERAAYCLQFEINDPRAGFITILRVELSSDVSVGKIFYSVLGDESDRSKAAHMLEGARGYIQRHRAISPADVDTTTLGVPSLFFENVKVPVWPSSYIRFQTPARSLRLSEACAIAGAAVTANAAKSSHRIAVLIGTSFLKLSYRSNGNEHISNLHSKNRH